MKKYRILRHSDGTFTVEWRVKIWDKWRAFEEYEKGSMWPHLSTKYFETLLAAEAFIDAKKKEEAYPVVVKEL